MTLRQKALRMILVGLCGKAAAAPFLLYDAMHTVLIVFVAAVSTVTGVVSVAGRTYCARAKVWRRWVGLLGGLGLVGLLVPREPAP